MPRDMTKDELGRFEEEELHLVSLLHAPSLVRRELMTSLRIVGAVLLVIGILSLAWGGLFWTDRDTVIDAGPLEVTTEEREGFSVPPVLGVAALLGGIVLLVWPARRRA